MAARRNIAADPAKIGQPQLVPARLDDVVEELAFLPVLPVRVVEPGLERVEVVEGVRRLHEAEPVVVEVADQAGDEVRLGDVVGVEDDEELAVGPLEGVVQVAGLGVPVVRPGDVDRPPARGPVPRPPAAGRRRTRRSCAGSPSGRRPRAWPAGGPGPRCRSGRTRPPSGLRGPAAAGGSSTSQTWTKNRNMLMMPQPRPRTAGWRRSGRRARCC